MENHRALTCPQQAITIQQLQDNRNQFKKKLDDNAHFWWVGIMTFPNEFFLACTYRQNFHKQTYRESSFGKQTYFENIPQVENILQEKFFGPFNIDKLKDLSKEQLERLQKTHINNYSALGAATMAGKVSFQEKQEFIQKLLDLGFKPTPEDKKLAFVEKWKRTGLVRKNIYLLLCARNDNANYFTQMQLPGELLTQLIFLMFETEKSLF